MIKKFINRLLGKSEAVSASPVVGPTIPLGERAEVPASEHRIDPTLLDANAVRVVKTLKDAGYEAYIVGGAVRDLLVGLRPKDFDVATNAPGFGPPVCNHIVPIKLARRPRATRGRSSS